MTAMLEQLFWRLCILVGVVLSVVVWRPIRDLLIGWSEPWAGWGLRTGLNGVAGFTSDAHPLGVAGGLAVLLLSVTLASAPAVVFIAVWARIAPRGVRDSCAALLRIAWIAGAVTIGTVVIGWMDAGRGSTTLDSAWAVSIIAFVWGIGMLVSGKLRELVDRLGILIVLSILVVSGTVLGLTIVPTFL